MKILAISPYLHTSSSALIINGKISAAASEERFNRKKNSSAFPEQSIKWCMSHSKVNWKELDLIVVPWNPAANIQYASKRWLENTRWRGETLTNVPANLMRLIDDKPPNEFEMKWSGNTLKFLNHHECHSAFSYFQSPYLAI